LVAGIVPSKVTLARLLQPEKALSPMPITGFPSICAGIVTLLPYPVYLRLFQNFSFWNSYLRFRGKTGLFPVFPEPVSKLTEFWNRLTYQ
jgi:hypothetical protein